MLSLLVCPHLTSIYFVLIDIDSPAVFVYVTSLPSIGQIVAVGSDGQTCDTSAVVSVGVLSATLQVREKRVIVKD